MTIWTVWGGGGWRFYEKLQQLEAVPNRPYIHDPSHEHA